MSGLPFTFGNATFHLLRTSGPKGFVLRFALIYGLVGLVLSAASLVLQWPLYEVYLRVFTEGEGDVVAYADEINAASFNANIVSLILIPVSLAIWVVFEAASQRRYVRGESFGLRLGGDEGRIAVVGLIWVALLIAAYIALVILVAIPTAIAFWVGGAWIGTAILVVSLLAGFGAFLWLFARLSPAGALTIRDRQIRFFEAWRVTRGRAGTLAGAYLTLLLIAIVGVLFLYATIGGVMFLQFVPLLEDGDAVGAEQVLAIAGRPGFWGPALLLLLLGSVLNGVFVHALGGPAALAAKHDPDWTGPDSVPGVFT